MNFIFEKFGNIKEKNLDESKQQSSQFSDEFSDDQFDQDTDNDLSIKMNNI